MSMTMTVEFILLRFCASKTDFNSNLQQRGTKFVARDFYLTLKAQGDCRIRLSGIMFIQGYFLNILCLKS